LLSFLLNVLVLSCWHIWNVFTQDICLFLCELKLIEKIVCTLHQALNLSLACSQLALCMIQRRLFFLIDLLSKQVHNLGFQKLLKTFERFLLPLYSLLFVPFSTHKLLVRPALLFSMPETFGKLLFLFRFRWFGPATLSCGLLCGNLIKRLLPHLLNLIH
jgi:hypothetical protein